MYNINISQQLKTMDFSAERELIFAYRLGAGGIVQQFNKQTRIPMWGVGLLAPTQYPIDHNVISKLKEIASLFSSSDYQCGYALITISTNPCKSTKKYIDDTSLIAHQLF